MLFYQRHKESFKRGGENNKAELFEIPQNKIYKDNKMKTSTNDNVEWLMEEKGNRKRKRHVETDK